MYEHKSRPLLSRSEFAKRMALHIAIAFVLIAFSLAMGMTGYHWLSELSWSDSLLNASMILAGMGPVNTLNDDPAKYFASFYALYSGIAFLSIVGVITAPVLHRFMHKFHLDEEER